ncbi:MAG: hypothetical protein JGK28_06540 [Microcoleus sp. PH2017_07_MST_O_A]|nr:MULTISPECIES: hypothetical protein [unclassified Microcoleus]MCC3417622.1 hypothetical protein [Microcoleus sp. PH2017_07_MST_O_A]MCC3593077.1 hypothetical protein [Microcoleus sp. PH2017_28_MFU_U_A]
MLGLLGGCQLVNFAVSGLDVGGLWGWDVRSHFGMQRRSRSLELDRTS